MTSASSADHPDDRLSPRQWSVGDSVFSAFPTTGSRLATWHHQGAPIIHWPLDATAPLVKVRGGNPILFPFSGRTFADGGEGQWRWQEVLRPMPRHGFARGGRFSATDTDDGFAAELIPTAEDRDAYPFEYAFRVEYRFRSDGFEVAFRLGNRGDVPIPWSAGHHFYFALPFTQWSQARLQFPSHRAWYHGPDGALVPAEPLADDKPRFSEPALVDRIHTHLSEPAVTFGPLPGGRHVSIRVDSASASEWTTFVVWTENDDSPFYCVEPWFGPPNGPGHGSGLATVLPGETGQFVVTVNVVDVV